MVGNMVGVTGIQNTEKGIGEKFYDTISVEPLLLHNKSWNCFLITDNLTIALRYEDRKTLDITQQLLNSTRNNRQFYIISLRGDHDAVELRFHPKISGSNDIVVKFGSKKYSYSTNWVAVTPPKWVILSFCNIDIW